MSREIRLWLAGLVCLVAAGCASDADRGNSATPPAAALDWLRAHSVPLASLDPANESYADLEAFGADVGAARIVALGEQSHGGKEESELKTRLVQYLHEQKGFDVLVLESGFFDVGRIWERMQDGARCDDEAPGNIFFMYSKSAEGRKLLQYVDRTQSSPRPLVIAGMDSNHTGLRSQNELTAMLEAFLKGRGSAIPGSNDWPTFVTAANGLFRMDQTPPPAASQAAFHGVVAALEGELCPPQSDSFQTTTSPGWWCQVAKSVEAQARTYWSGATNNPSVGDYQRDNVMGDNLIWLAEKAYPGRKVITWSHIVHAMYSRPIDATHRMAGTVVREYFGTSYYVANLTAHDGAIRDFNDLSRTQSIPAAAQPSLESLFDQTGHAALFLANPADRTGAEWLDTTPARFQSFEYANAPANGLGQYWDAYFYFKTVTPMTMVR